MITAEMEVKKGRFVPENDTEVYEYPPELLKHWADISKDMKAKIARGELKPQTVEEAAAELGIILD